MSILELICIGAEQPLITFDRMLIIVGVGLMTVYFDGRLMNQKGLHRESRWAKFMGWSLVAIGFGAWLGFIIFD
jgi:hydrogenase/urease accessory protein HupE